jgi:transcriptional regulator with XRE-family HTH domain
LRNLRRQQNLSLLAVEEASGREFKASVLGAYERGERIISVLRLQRLAHIYGVPVDQLLPRPSNGPGATDARPAVGHAPTRRTRGLTIDLSRLAALEAPEKEVLRRYVGMIELQRGDFNGRVLTIRGEDVNALGRVFELEEDHMRDRLSELGIIAQPS